MLEALTPEELSENKTIEPTYWKGPNWAKMLSLRQIPVKFSAFKIKESIFSLQKKRLSHLQRKNN